MHTNDLMEKVDRVPRKFCDLGWQAYCTLWSRCRGWVVGWIEMGSARIHA